MAAMPLRLSPLLLVVLGAMAGCCVVLLGTSPRHPVVLEGDAAETFSVSAALEPQFQAVHHYPDPQGMPDAALIRKTIDQDHLALSRLAARSVGVSHLRLAADDLGRSWSKLLDSAEAAKWKVDD
eukprot:CAMPEP_0173421594 /NCGR_PEP_ID=MMETSP1357-20121228/2657_1 /TAXON_ID=77926 /ORGANISM="Hemiselmis rufescens, Strain PCC563" /LENGTH=124 /DNA_ID=CAMNT_0014384527 /DNA_START=1 /DNA_END=372 /DNA_ORIENTATION=+